MASANCFAACSASANDVRAICIAGSSLASRACGVNDSGGFISGIDGLLVLRFFNDIRWTIAFWRFD
jgi:hypothetical protein